MRSGTLPVVVLALAALTTAACGTDNAPASPGSLADKAACTVEDVKVGGEPGKRPTVTIPDTCAPPTTLLMKDLTPGSDPVVKAGDAVDTNYLLVTWSNKKEVDASWNRGQTFQVAPVGQARVIDGWNEGLIGMKQGSRRLLIIPADKGYGPDGNSGIKGGETLVFVVDAAKVTPGA
ncbi:FKBP-type peptidyl-prolyl cis-trans isomerase [Longispora sp. NPDC051575]|uniref:FKBP-type peptidyl-prolyl cis-trans isomerase n=1 Tax=Longispora sp. NPDC051575 TaxID=3154943 RepID=UPI003439EA59